MVANTAAVEQVFRDSKNNVVLGVRVHSGTFNVGDSVSNQYGAQAVILGIRSYNHELDHAHAGTVCGFFVGQQPAFSINDALSGDSDE